MSRPADPAAPPRLAWRAMRVADLPAVEAVGEAVHTAYPEDPEVFAERLALFPFGCHVLEGEDGLVGYLISHPWRRAAPPALNARLGGLPERPGTYYIHDLALLPGARGRGVARRVVRAMAAMAISQGLDEMSLVAVGGSGGVWATQGFARLEVPELAAKLASYDAGAAYMRRLLR